MLITVYIKYFYMLYPKVFYGGRGHDAFFLVLNEETSVSFIIE